MRRHFILLAAVLVSACATARSRPAHTSTQVVWTADFMKTKPGQLDRYLRYLEANWAKSRRTLLARGEIVAYRVLVVRPTNETPWDVVLLTAYPDSATHARAEEIFRPVMDAQGETRIDGLSGRGPDNPLKQTITSVVLNTSIEGGPTE